MYPNFKEFTQSIIEMALHKNGHKDRESLDLVKDIVLFAEKKEAHKR